MLQFTFIYEDSLQGKSYLALASLNHSVLEANTMSVTPTFLKKLAIKHHYFGLSLITTLAFANCFTLPVNAHSIIYSAPSDNQSGGFNGEVPVKQIGSLLLPKAVVQFKNTEVNILAVPDWLFDRSVVLSGALIKAQVDVQSKGSNLHGLVYFMDGLWLANLSSANAPEIIDTISGERLRGRIRSRLDDAFAFKPETGPMRKLLFTEIKNINSPEPTFLLSLAAQVKLFLKILLYNSMLILLVFLPLLAELLCPKTQKYQNRLLPAQNREFQIAKLLS